MVVRGFYTCPSAVFMAMLSEVRIGAAPLIERSTGIKRKCGHIYGIADIFLLEKIRQKYELSGIGIVTDAAGPVK